MKMSDVFELPLFAKNHEVGSRCSIYEGRGVTVASSFYANQLQSYEFICKAVNSHDRLTSDVERLTLEKLAEVNARHYEVESLKKKNARLLECLRALLYSDIYADAEGCYEISKEDTDEVAAAKQLLTELEKGDE